MRRSSWTSPATNTPRKPNPQERQQLADWLSTLGYDPADAKLVVQAASVAVFDGYRSDGPGYAGKIMTVVWTGGPTYYDVFTWSDGKLVHEGREIDQRECYRCGSKGGTLCVNCWRTWSANNA